MDKKTALNGPWTSKRKEICPISHWLVAPYAVVQRTFHHEINFQHDRAVIVNIIQKVKVIIITGQFYGNFHLSSRK
jgi:hypothetical protein